MMKKLMFLSLLIVLGVSFAQAPPITSGPEWLVLKQTACQGGIAWLQTWAAGLEYEVGDSCSTPEMPYAPEELCDRVCSLDGGLVGYYWDMNAACDRSNPSYSAANCLNAKTQLYSFASASRGMFSAVKTAHLLAARQALYAYRNYGCDTEPGDVAGILSTSNSIYKECMAADSETLLGEMYSDFCLDICSDDA